MKEVEWACGRRRERPLCQGEGLTLVGSGVVWDLLCQFPNLQGILPQQFIWGKKMCLQIVPIQLPQSMNKWRLQEEVAFNSSSYLLLWFYFICGWIDFCHPWVNKLEIILKFTVLVLPHVLHEWSFEKENWITSLLKILSWILIAVDLPFGILTVIRVHDVGECFLPSSSAHLLSLSQKCPRSHYTRQLSFCVYHPHYAGCTSF